jgi:hypothetical protein
MSIVSCPARSITEFFFIENNHELRDNYNSKKAGG